MEKCKKHNRTLLPCRCERWEGECLCIPQCETCIRVARNKRKKDEKKWNWAIEVTKNETTPGYDAKISAFKFKPRNKLKKGDYAVIDLKTGYLIKATTSCVQFYVVK